MFTHVDPDKIPPVIVGPGCTRRDLPTIGNVRAWIVDIEAGAQWPHVDQHDALGEEVMVISGELIEDDRRFPAGSYILYHGNSGHRPRTEIGVRLFGFNVLAQSPA